MSDGSYHPQLRDLSIRLAKVEESLTAVQVAIGRLETSNKMLAAIGGVTATALAGVLVKMLTA
tara:strand:- start:182 stop:370 length:189 start_codon:yes stop_codon:yes gene_type:complete